MTARPFVNFIERKLIENRVQKVVPQTDITEQHAHRLVKQGLARDAPTGSTIGLPKRQRLTGCRDLNEQIRLFLKRQPELSWDIAGNDRQRRLLKDGRIKMRRKGAS